MVLFRICVYKFIPISHEIPHNGESPVKIHQVFLMYILHATHDQSSIQVF